MPFNSVDQISAAVDQGATWYSTVFKTSVPFIQAGIWHDAGPGTGIPTYQAYLGNPLVAQKVLGGYNNQSIFLGPSVAADQKKYLLNWSISTASGVSAPCHFYLIDVLLYYPYVDGTNSDTQFLENSSELPRFLTGENVYAMFVSQTPGTATVANVDVTYTNSKNVSGRTSKITLVGSTSIGRIMNTNGTTTATSFYMAMANGDSGIRKIESVNFNQTVGGFVNIVLFKPIAQLSIWEQSTFHEKNFLRETGVLPSLEGTSALNLIFLQGNGGGNIGNVTSFLQTVWG